MLALKGLGTKAQAYSTICITYNTAGMWSRLSMFLLACGEFPGLPLSRALMESWHEVFFVNFVPFDHSHVCLPPRLRTFYIQAERGTFLLTILRF